MRSLSSPAFRARNARPLRIGMVVAGVIMAMAGAELSNEFLDFMDHGRAGASGALTTRQFLVLLAVGIGAIAVGISEYYDLLAFET